MRTVIDHPRSVVIVDTRFTTRITITDSDGKVTEHAWTPFSATESHPTTVTPQDPPYLTNHTDCVEEVGHLASWIVRVAFLTENMPSDTELRTQLRLMTAAITGRPSVLRAWERGTGR